MLDKTAGKGNSIQNRKNVFLSDTQYNPKHIDFEIQRREKFSEAEMSYLRDSVSHKIILQILSMMKFLKTNRKAPLNFTRNSTETRRRNKMQRNV